MAITAHPDDLDYLESHYPPALVDFILTGADDAAHTDDVLALPVIECRAHGTHPLIVVATLDHVRAYAEDITAAGYAMSIVIPARAAA